MAQYRDPESYRRNAAALIQSFRGTNRTPLQRPIPGSLILADKDTDTSSSLAPELIRLSFDVTTTTHLQETLNAATKHQATYVLLDMKLKDGNGLSLIPSLKEQVPGIRIVVLTSHGSLAAATWAIREGAIDFLTKPSDPKTIRNALTATGARANVAKDCPNPYEVRRRYIHNMVANNNYNMTRSAAALGLTRRSVQRRLAEDCDITCACHT